MRILLTNDDGVISPGLQSLKNVLEKDHEVWIFAPDGERSGTSHRITLKGPIMRMAVGERSLSCTGTPADCVILGLLGALPEKPEMVVSGINIGPNIGTDVVYSGTAAAARQAALMGIPSIAVSLDSFKGPFHFDPLSRFVADNLELFLDLWDGEHFLNINAPNAASYLGVEITHPSRRFYHDRIVEFIAPDGHSYYFIQGSQVETISETGSDWNAVSQGKISLSPVLLQPVNHKEDARYRGVQFKFA